MKLGEGIFGDDFITFSLSKPPKMGYTPAAGALAGEAPDCILVECDPDADTAWPCEKTCFSDAELCKCGCGKCEEPYCDCDNPTGSSSGYYEDYLQSSGGYNFGSDQCHAFGGVGMMDSTGPTSEECNCRHCPSVIKDAFPPCADGQTENCLTPEQVAQCCKDQTEKKPCTNSAGETAPYEWKAQTNWQGKVCYYCNCPAGYTPKAPTKYICTIGDSPTCEETLDPNGYATLPECQAAIAAGNCAERWKCKAEGGCEETTTWSDPYKSQQECDDSSECVVKFYYCKWNSYQFSFKCEETKDQTWSPPGGEPVQWYTSQELCEQAISGNQGNCATGYICRPDPLGTFLPSKCQKWPSNSIAGQGAATAGDVWATEAECQKACCTASEYPSAIGMCMWNEYISVPGGIDDFVRKCDVISRGECAAKPTWCGDGVTYGCEPFFLCCGDGLGYSGCNCGDYNGSGCPGGAPDCGTGFITWTVQPDVFGAGSIESCSCRPAPDQTPANS